MASYSDALVREMTATREDLAPPKPPRAQPPRKTQKSERLERELRGWAKADDGASYEYEVCCCCFFDSDAPKVRPRNLSRWAALTAAIALIFVGASAWAYLRLEPSKSTLKCVVDGYNDLKEYSTARNLTAASEVFEAIDQTTVDRVQMGLDNWDGVVAPGFVTAIILLLAALNSACCWPSGRCMSKLLVLLTNLVLLLSLVFFGALLAAAIISGMARFEGIWDDAVGSVCKEMSQQMAQQLNETKNGLHEAALHAASAAELFPYQEDVREAESQVASFDDVCECIDSTLAALRPLLGPGALGVAGFLLGSVSINGLCCSMGCCTSPAARAQRRATKDAKKSVSL